jgi:hypothetical protein
MSNKIFQTSDKVRVFQLYLLSVMRVQPAKLSKTLKQLHSTAVELELAKRSMEGQGFKMIGGPTIEFYKEMLGPPHSEEPIDNNKLPTEFHNSKELRFKLPLWSDFDFVVNELPDGGTFDPSFRRSIDVPVPPLRSLSDLEPWEFVKEEVNARFGLPQFGDAWDNWEELDYMIPAFPGEEPQKCSVIFDFNLLQLAKTYSSDR